MEAESVGRINPPEPGPVISPEVLQRHIEAKQPPQPRPRDERTEAMNDYANACRESGTPAEQRFAADYFRSQAQREQYFRERPTPGPPMSLPQPFPRAPVGLSIGPARVGDGGDKPCSLGDIKIRR
jgi:hypothetical protein